MILLVCTHCYYWNLGMSLVFLFLLYIWVLIKSVHSVKTRIVCNIIITAIAGKRVGELKADLLATLYDVGGIIGKHMIQEV